MPRQLLLRFRSLVVGLVIIILLPACSTTREPGEIRGNDHPFGTGSVEFVGFSAEELQEIRVIPEDGARMFTPRGDVRIENVDGFWWSGNRDYWFKIPDHCHSSISRAPHRLVYSHDCSQLGTRVQKLRGQPGRPGWQLDSGNTRHGTDYPFQVYGHSRHYPETLPADRER